MSNPRSPRPTRSAGARKMFKQMMWAVVDMKGNYHPEIHPYWDEANESRNKYKELCEGKFKVIYVQVRELPARRKGGKS